VSGTGERLQAEFIYDGAKTRLLLGDGLGTVRLEQANGAIEATTTYEPFGNLLVQTGPSGTTYGFTGEQHDAATGFVYLRARYYSPSLRVFMSKDPWPGNAWQPGTLNAHVYVLNNPLQFIDPERLMGWGAAVGGAVGAMDGGAMGGACGALGGAMGGVAGALAGGMLGAACGSNKNTYDGVDGLNRQGKCGTASKAAAAGHHDQHLRRELVG
jgi:RHS repeat-associated protein